MIWLNGALMPQGQARIDPMDRGFTLGDGLFETIRVAEGKIWWLGRHWARLSHGAGVLGIAIPYTVSEIEAAIRQLMAVHPDPLNGVIRLTVSRGIGARGIQPPTIQAPTIVITVAPMVIQDQPVNAMIATQTRRNEFSCLSRIKTTAYLDSIIARQEAVQRGGNEAILLNTQGYVAEAAVGNVFFMIDGCLVTPRIEDGALPGIARGLLLERIGAIEDRIGPEDILRAEYGIITNVLAIRSINSINFIELKQSVFDDFIFGKKIKEIFD